MSYAPCIWRSGLLERDQDALYDTALLFGPDSGILLRYRRMSPTWHARHADPAVYREGTTVPCCQTPLGRFAFLLCGDITVDDLIDHVRALQPDWLLFPLARGFDADVRDERRWRSRRSATMRKRVARIGAPTLLVNYVSAVDGCFGGAVAYARDGTVVARRRLHAPGLLAADLK